MLTALRLRLGANAFDVVDHWDADLCAVGIARPDNHGILVYVSTYRRADQNYFVSLELPPDPGDELGYKDMGERETKGFDELVDVIRKHFGNEPLG
jgi:hypothetical protein